MAHVEKKIPRRVNRNDLRDIFTKGGFLRSYTLRMKITGREYRKKPMPKQSVTDDIPISKTPKRSINRSTPQDKKAGSKGFRTMDVNDDVFSNDNQDYTESISREGFSPEVQNEVKPFPV
jgi:hypothetical protein